MLAIEPMVTAGRATTRTLDDGWTVVTADGSRAAHFEHTVAITDDGPEILTASLTEPGLCSSRPDQVISSVGSLPVRRAQGRTKISMSAGALPALKVMLSGQAQG